MEENITLTQTEETPEVQEETTEQPIVETTETTEAPEATESTKSEINAHYAQMRRNKELKEAKAEAQKAAAEAEQLKQRLAAVLKAQGIDGIEDANKALDRLEADARGISVDEIIKERETQRAAFENSPEYKAMKEEIEQARREKNEMAQIRDLDILKKAYPEIKAEKVSDLGEDFIALLATQQALGNEINEDTLKWAYEASKLKTTISQKPKPKGMGKIGVTDKGSSEYFTSDELDNLTSRELDDEKTLYKAIKSLTKLK